MSKIDIIYVFMLELIKWLMVRTSYGTGLLKPQFEVF